MDRKTGSTAGPTCASCEECTAEATINVAAHARALNRCVRRTVSHGVARARDGVNGRIASAKEAANERLGAAKRRALSYWERMKQGVGLSRLYGAERGRAAWAPPAASGAGARWALGTACCLSLAALAGFFGRKALRLGQRAASLGAGRAAGAEEDGLLR